VTTQVTVHLKEQKKKEKKSGENVIGVIQLKMSDLSDQKPVEKWFEMLGPENQVRII